MKIKKKKESKEEHIVRPPIVAVLGHIDHGKTTLLDTIKKTNVAGKESGNITQHIGAYEIIHTLEGKEKSITFIDTPGHAAFSQMRNRGSEIADIALLVIAADDGVKPQTVEALKHIATSKVELIVVINKIDKPGAQSEKIKQQLAEHNILLEGWGGTVPFQEISAKTGKGVAELLDLILLVAEMQALIAYPTSHAEGIVIEAHKDAHAGITATLIIKNGTLRIGDNIAAGNAIGKIKSMHTAFNEPLQKATFSAPVMITGLSAFPGVGELFQVTVNKKIASELAKNHISAHALTPEGITEEESIDSPKEEIKHEKHILNIILKTDVYGTKEALEKMILDLQYEEIETKIIKSETGMITENDIMLAKSAQAIIIAFKIKTSKNLIKLTQNTDVQILYADIIYEVVDGIKKIMQELIPPEIIRHDIGTLTILATFKIESAKMIVGGKVTKGKIKKGINVEVTRKGEHLFTGKISQLQHDKKDVKEVEQGRECGMMITQSLPFSSHKIEIGDELIIFEEETKARELK